MEDDPAVTLHHYVDFGDLYWSLFVPRRDEAAYEARLAHSLAEICRVTGMDPHTVIRYCHNHRNRTGAGPLPRHDIQDVSGAIDLTGLTRSRKQQPPAP